MRSLAYVAVAVALQCIAVLAVQGNAKIQEAFKKNNYVPYILPEVPQNVVKAYYPSIDVCLGNVISQTRLSVPPRIEYDFQPGVNYTIIMFDPDIPSAQYPELKNYLVWFVTNIDGGTGCESGEVIASYITPTPYPGSGCHRYTIALYEQTKTINVIALLSRRFGVKRYKFNMVAIAEEYGLKLVAANFFIVCVPAIYEEYYCQSPSCINAASALSNFKSLIG